MRVAALCFIIGTVLCAAAPSLGVLILGRILVGVGGGFGNQAVPLFLSAIRDGARNLRGGLNILFQLAVTVGIFIANLVNYGTNKINGWGWRLALGGAAVPAALLALGGIFLLDIPTSLIERGHYEEGKRVLQKVRGAQDVEK